MMLWPPGKSIVTVNDPLGSRWLTTGAVPMDTPSIRTSAPPGTEANVTAQLAPARIKIKIEKVVEKFVRSVKKVHRGGLFNNSKDLGYIALYNKKA